MPSGPIPLSGYQYQQDAGQSGIGAATGGLGGLAQAIVGNPAALANARYQGALTGQAQANTQQTQDDLDGRSMAASLAQNPGALTTPQGIATLSAAALKSPTVAAGMANIMGNVMAANAAMGTQGAGAVSQPQADAFNTTIGRQNAQNTVAGEAATNATGIQESNISAGATVASANISAGATRYSADREAQAVEADTAATIKGENQRTLVPVSPGPGMPAKYMTAVQAGATGAGYSSEAMNTQNNAPTPVMTPYGPRVVTTGQAETQGMTPAPATTDQATAGIVAQNTGTWMAPDTTGPGVSQGMGATFGTPQATAPGAVPQVGQVAGAPPPVPAGEGATPIGQNQGLANSVMSKYTGQPMPSAMTPNDVTAMDKIIVGRITTGMPTGIGANAPAPAVTDAIRQQAAWLYANGRHGERSNMQAAITTAMQNVVGKNQNGGFANLTQDLHVIPGWVPGAGQPGPSQLVMKPGAQIIWPQGMTVPSVYQNQGSGMPAAFSGGQPTAPAPANTGLPAAFGGGQPAPAAPSAPQGITLPQAPVPGQGQPQAPVPGQGQAPAPAQGSIPIPQGMTAQQVMAQAQDAINRANATSPPAVAAQQIAAIKQRLMQMGVLPPMPPGTPH